MRPRPAARKSKKRQPTKGQPNMAASPTTRISQPNSRPSARNGTARLNKEPGRRATITTCAAPPAQVLPRDSIRGQNPKTRSVPKRTARVIHSKTISRSDATACAAPPAQALPRDSIRGQNPKTRSVPDRTACAVLPATSCFTWQLSLPGCACRGVKLIYGSAIKTSHKRQRISKLQNSNRR
jgi:hypothetical protein